MPGNTFGKLFRLTSFGESHGKAVGGIIDGCPPGIPLDIDDIQEQLDRRKPGAFGVVSSRSEDDKVEIISGLYEGITTGAPIAFLVKNEGQRSSDYEEFKDILRPSHADLTVFLKYGIQDHRGGGRLSGRETLSRVVAGSVARQLLSQKGVEIVAYASRIGDIEMQDPGGEISSKEVYLSDVRCPEQADSQKMSQLLTRLKEEGDSIGGIVTCRVKNVPPGLGEPVFEKLDSDLASAMMSIGGAKGFDIGEGFLSAAKKGSENNDEIFFEGGKFYTITNHAGGILGGISNGMEIYFRVAFKPVASISRPQRTVTKKGEPAVLNIKGRHDTCIVPRAVTVVESMTALVLADHLLRARI